MKPTITNTRVKAGLLSLVFGAASIINFAGEEAARAQLSTNAPASVAPLTLEISKALGPFEAASPVRLARLPQTKPDIGYVSARDSKTPESVKSYAATMGYGKSESLTLNAGVDPNPNYSRVYPYPEILLVGAFRHVMDGGPGIQGVKAARERWPWPPPNIKSIPESYYETKWSWSVPEERRTDWPFFSDINGRHSDRYAALCLKPSVSPATRYYVYMFDSEAKPSKALRWSAEVPIREALTAYRTTPRPPQPPDITGPPGAAVFIIASHDGTRVWLVATDYSLNATFVFTFDGADGKLMNTRALAGRRIGSTRDILRAPTASAFAIGFDWEEPREETTDGVTKTVWQKKYGSLLFDADAKPVSAFTDRAGEPVVLRSLTDTHAAASYPLAASPAAEGEEKRPPSEPSYQHLYFKLPLSPDPVAPASAPGTPPFSSPTPPAAPIRGPIRPTPP